MGERTSTGAPSGSAFARVPCLVSEVRSSTLLSKMTARAPQIESAPPFDLPPRWDGSTMVLSTSSPI